jgi:CDP-glycerol glycerophosphotransferase (TagB/SpsB family)
MHNSTTSLQAMRSSKATIWRKLILRAIYLITVKYMWVIPGRALLRLFSYLVPRDPDLWVFGHSGGKRFADNAKGLFLEALAHQDMTAVWMTESQEIFHFLDSEGLPVCRRRTVKGLWLGLRAGVYVFDLNQDDINYWTSHGALSVNLWHGIPLKKLERDVTIRVSHIYDAFRGKLWAILATKLISPWVLNGYDLIAVTSQHQRSMYARAFGVDLEKVKVLGQPRNDVLLKPRSHSLRHKDAFQIMLEEAKGEGRRVLLYMPTYRQYSASWEKEPQSLPWGLESHLRLSDDLLRMDAKLFIKPHPWDTAQWSTLGPTGTIQVISGSVDVYDSLKYVDLLITDYSSIYFDFLLLDRPIIFYCYDLEEYLSRERGMYYEYSQVTPGAKARTLDQLLDAIARELHERADRYRDERRAVTSRFHEFADGESSLRTIQEIRRLQQQRRSRQA